MGLCRIFNQAVILEHTFHGQSCSPQEKRLPTGALEAFCCLLLRLVAGVRNLPIAPTIKFEIPIVEVAA
jgi:hypothetical protein